MKFKFINKASYWRKNFKQNLLFEFQSNFKKVFFRKYVFHMAIPCKVIIFLKKKLFIDVPCDSPHSYF